MQEGTIKFFDSVKGFGFITPKDGSADIFVHTTGLVDDVRDNDSVNFETQMGKRGLNAVNVTVLS